ncbi:CIC11C00000000257 [Sungouiella intermedia]|uniref:CIC11C00000000257 n=1 Tax=Sungouiella intermedia TaxID=45354 RepID=A0A1L0DNX9_9ASCO|nr:CIC11C00000000257 [[Candida] intermedia]
MDNQSPGRSFETLIPIDDFSDSSSGESEKNGGFARVLAQSSVENFEADLNKLKQDSSAKFKKRWQEIILRYSEIDDEIESDEIDLHTGKITVDNGHLRSLAGEGQMINGVKVHSSIWTGDYDYDKIMKEEDRLQRQQRKAKQQMREKLKREDRFYNSSPSTIDSDVFGDRLVVDVSPSKRLSISPLKRKFSLPSGYISPVKRSVESRDSPNHSPLRYQSQSVSYSPLGNNSPAESLPESKKSSQNSNLPRRSKPRKLSFENYIHDDLYSMVSDLNDDIQLSLYTCAFSECRYTSETKTMYRSHLLLKHVSELRKIGYPVTIESNYEDPKLIAGGVLELPSKKAIDLTIPEMTILKLNLHFPLQISISPGCPYVCKRNIGSGKCTKSFMSSKQLVEHQQKYPHQCSTRRQVLLCPILGCDYMTDCGGEEWRDHVNSKHSGDVKPPKMAIIDNEVMESIEDVFSDSVSSLDFSGDEKGEPEEDEDSSEALGKKGGEEEREEREVRLGNEATVEEKTKIPRKEMDDFWTPNALVVSDITTLVCHNFEFEIVTSDDE